MSSTAAETGTNLAARAAAVIPGGVNSGQRQVAGLEDLVIASTSGSTFTDGDGRVFTDYHSAFGPPLLGHNDPDVDGAVAAAGRTVDLMGVGVTQVEVELAERLVAAVPSVEKVLLTATGSEATFHALRVARTATGRRHVLKFQGCYHGWHDSVAMNVISPAERVGSKDPLSQGILPEVLDATIVVPVQRRGRRGARALASTTWPRSSSSRSRTTSARCCRSRASSSGCASSRRSTGRCSSSTR